MEISGSSSTQTRFRSTASFLLAHPAIADVRAQHTLTRTAQLIIVHHMQSILKMLKTCLFEENQSLNTPSQLVQNQYFSLSSIPNYQGGHIFLVTQTQFPAKLNSLG